MENNYMLIKKEANAYRVTLYAQDCVGCEIKLGNKSLRMDSYDERMWAYHLYGDGKLGWITLWLNEKMGDSLTEDAVDMAISSFKSKHILIGVPCFDYRHIPLYADSESGLNLHVSGHVCVISLQEECDLLDKIANNPLRESVKQNLETWFNSYCRSGRYDFLKSCRKEQVDALCRDFLIQHGVNIQQFPLVAEVKAREDAAFRERRAAQLVEDEARKARISLGLNLLGFLIIAGGIGIVDNVHTGSLDADGIIIFFVLTFAFLFAAICFTIASNEKR